MAERAAEQVRGRVIVVGPGGRLRRRLGRRGAARHRLRHAARRSRARSTASPTRRSATARRSTRRSSPPRCPSASPAPATTIGAVRMTQSVDAVDRATRRATLGLVAIGLLVLVLGLGAGALIAGQVAGPVRRLDQAARRVAEGDLSARAKVEGSAEQQRLARTFNDMTVAARAAGGQPARVRRRRLAPAPHAAQRAAAAARGGPRLDRRRRTPTRRSTPACASSTGCRRWSPSCSCSRRRARSTPRPSASTSRTRRAAPRRAGTAPRAAASAPSGDAGRRLRAARRPRPRARRAVENAIHYGNGEVEVRSRPGAVEVLDRGPGLSDEDLAAVFERFHRGAAGRSGPERHRPRAADRARAGAPLGRRRHARQPRRRRRAGDAARPALSRRLTDRGLRCPHAPRHRCSGSCSPPAACCSWPASRSPRRRSRRSRSASPPSR